jgi:hypothetical protein
MAGGYILCDYGRVKKVFPEFKAATDALEAQLLSLASADWAPLQYGGMNPMSGQFGKSPILPPLFADFGSTQMTTWNQWLTATGDHQIMVGAATGGTIIEDYKVGLMGLQFVEFCPRITEFKLTVGDINYPRINIEEMFCYDEPTVVFEEGIPLDEETGFLLQGYIEAQGPMHLRPIGIQLNRVPNKIQVTQTGAVLPLV